MNLKLTKETLLSYIDEESIFSRYFPKPIQLKRNVYTNPFRFDNREGSCHFAYDSRGKLRFYDKAIGRSYDCFDCIMNLYNCSFYKSMLIVCEDFNINLFSKVQKVQLTRTHPKIVKCASIKKTNKVHYKVVPRKWNEVDKNYWYNRYKITSETLRLYGVIPVLIYHSSTCLQNWKLRYEYSESDPCYCYYKHTEEGLAIKLYRPYSSDSKWRSNSISNYIYGYDELINQKESPKLFPVEASTKKKKLFITASLKDGMCLLQSGYKFICGSSEIFRIQDSIIENLRKKYEIIYLLDNDQAGVNWSIKMSIEKDLSYAVLPPIMGLKDVADFREKFNDTEFKNIIDDLKIRKWIDLHKTNSLTNSNQELINLGMAS